MILAMLDVFHNAGHMLAQGLQVAIIIQRGAQHLKLQVMRLCSQQCPHVRWQLLHAQGVAAGVYFAPSTKYMRTATFCRLNSALTSLPCQRKALPLQSSAGCRPGYGLHQQAQPADGHCLPATA